MKKVHELCDETAVRCAVEEWCHKLGWRCVLNAWDCSVRTDTGSLTVAYCHRRGIPHVELWVSPPRIVRSLPLESAMFFLRRNSELTRLLWCITRHDGLTLRAVQEFEGMTEETFNKQVTDLQEEWREVMEIPTAEEIKPDGKDGAT